MQMPIYQVIENDIKEQILKKELLPGEIIPSENQLKEKYNVSRMTVRQALNNLVNDGYLYKHKGKGTFVSKRKIEKSIHGVRGFTEEMESLGRQVKNKITEFIEIEANDEIREKLFLDKGEQVIYVNRIRYGDDIPVLHEKLYLPKSLFKDLTVDDMENSFYDYIENKLNFKISHCLQSIEAKLGSREVSDALKVPKQFPILEITRNTFLTNGRPFEYVESSYRSDQYRFVQYAIRN